MKTSSLPLIEGLIGYGYLFSVRLHSGLYGLASGHTGRRASSRMVLERRQRR